MSGCWEQPTQKGGDYDLRHDANQQRAQRILPPPSALLTPINPSALRPNLATIHEP